MEPKLDVGFKPISQTYRTLEIQYLPRGGLRSTGLTS